MMRLFTIINAIIFPVVAELIVLGIAEGIAKDSAMFWQFAARYSARVSFLIFAGLLLYTAMYGLSTIDYDASKRKILGALIYLFWANHIIHLIFLSANQAVQNKILFKPGNILGMISYAAVLLIPLLLNGRLSNKRKQSMLLIMLLVISAFFIQVYMNRIWGTPQPPHPSALWVYALFVSILILLVLANLYRHIKGSRGYREVHPNF